MAHLLIHLRTEVVVRLELKLCIDRAETYPGHPVPVTTAYSYKNAWGEDIMKMGDSIFKLSCQWLHSLANV